MWMGKTTVHHEQGMKTLHVILLILSAAQVHAQTNGPVPVVKPDADARLRMIEEHYAAEQEVQDLIKAGMLKEASRIATQFSGRFLDLF